MAVINDLEKKNAEELLKDLNNIMGDVGSLAFEIARSAIQVRVANLLCNSIDGARKEFIPMMGDLRRSIDDFRKSSEKASRAIILLTVVLAATAVVQVVLAVLK